MAEELYEIVYKEGVGHCLQATRDIQPLEVILVEAAAVKGPHHESALVCVQCLRLHEGSYFCADCSLPLCSDQCREEKEHRRECPVLQQLHTVCQDLKQVQMLLMTLRLSMLRLDKPPVWNTVDKLMDHREERQHCTEEWSMFQTDIVAILKPVLQTEDEELINRIIGIICVNAIGFDLPDQRIKGRGLYPVVSLVSHNCVSNARYTVNSEDFSITLRARRKINVGEEITINYVPPIFGIPKRRRHLEEEWFFQCKCTRCLDPTEFGTYVSALQCSNCREGLILPETIEKDSLWRCRFCMNPFESSYIHNFVQNLEEELYSISKLSPSVKEENFESFIKDHSGDLHTKHYLNLIAQRNLIQLLSQEPKTRRETQKKIVRYCRNLLTIMSRVDPGYSQWMGRVLRRSNEAELALLKLDLQENRVDKNKFAEKSEIIWASMKDVENCEVLCTPAFL